MKPQTFSDVWYLPSGKAWGNFDLLTARDRGMLIVHENWLEFHGQKHRVYIRNVQSINFGKQSKDTINDWVSVKYGANPPYATAWFADGSLFGWGSLLGRSKRIFAAVQDLLHPVHGEQLA